VILSVYSRRSNPDVLPLFGRSVLQELVNFLPANSQHLDPLDRPTISHFRALVVVPNGHLIPGPIRVLVREVGLKPSLLAGDVLLDRRRYRKESPRLGKVWVVRRQRQIDNLTCHENGSSAEMVFLALLIVFDPLNEDKIGVRDFW